MKCDKCGYDDKGTGDTAHVCGPVNVMPVVPDNKFKMWADPRFQILANVLKLLECSRVWGGQDWIYHPIHPFQYMPVRDQVRNAMDALKAEYGVEE